MHHLHYLLLLAGYSFYFSISTLCMFISCSNSCSQSSCGLGLCNIYLLADIYNYICTFMSLLKGCTSFRSFKWFCVVLPIVHALGGLSKWRGNLVPEDSDIFSFLLVFSSSGYTAWLLSAPRASWYMTHPVGSCDL